MPTTSKQVFVEYFRRNTLCSPGGHIVSADPTDTGKDYWSEADYKFLKGEWDERETQWFIENSWYVHDS